jgi:hypothetical protein
VTLVDADSLQVRDPDGGVFRSRVGKAEFTPPELQGVSFETVDRAPEHDRFGLAVLLYLLLMEGTHPFAARLVPGIEATPVEERIRRGLFPHARPDDDCHPPRLSPRFDTLDERVREMFMRAFVAGHTDPAARPTAAEWRDALEAAEARLAECAANPLHRHAPHLEACPWCERAALLGGRDPFPAGAPEQASAPRPRHPRRLAAPGPFAAAAQPPAPMPVSPYGVRRQRIQSIGRPTPTVLGPSGLLNPVVVIPTAFVLALFGGGAVAALGVVAMIASLLTLARPRFRRPVWSTGVLAVAMLFVALIVTSLPHDRPVPGSVLRDLPPAAPVAQTAPDVLPHPTPPDVAEPTTGSPYLLPDLVASLSGQPDGSMPPLSDAGDAAPANGYTADLSTVQSRPVLLNEEDARYALAVFYRAAAVGTPPPDTAVLWLRVGTDGRVPPDGGAEISASSLAAQEAAGRLVPHLRFRPARDRVGPVAVWVAQRMLIER